MKTNTKIYVLDIIKIVEFKRALMFQGIHFSGLY